jgi:hypothetical protein
VTRPGGADLLCPPDRDAPKMLKSDGGRVLISQFVLPRTAQSCIIVVKTTGRKIRLAHPRGHWMKLVRITSRVGGLLELATSQCPNCEEVTTIENDE